MTRIALATVLLIPVLAAAQTATAPPDEKALEAQVAREPKSGLAWLRLGTARQKAKKLDAAAEAYQKAIDLKFGVPVAAYNLATVHALRGDRDKALASFELATSAGFAKLDEAEADPDLAALRGDPRWPAALKKARATAFPCGGAPKHRELDFWIGEWEVRAAQGHLLGTSSVQSIVGSCVIFENWSGSLGHTGKSFNFYDGELGKWRQVWVDDGGKNVDYVGELEGGVMHYQAEVKQPDGKVAKQRMTFTPMADGRVRQLWEQSTDGGKSWSPLFEGYYAKKK